MLTPRQYRELMVRIRRCKRNIYVCMRRHRDWSMPELRDAVGHQVACLRRHNRAIREG